MARVPCSLVDTREQGKIYAKLFLMRKIRKFLPLLFLGLSLLGILVFLIINFPPNFYMNFGILKINSFYIFLISLFVSGFGIFSFILRNFRRGFFIGLFSVVFFYLRYLNLTHIFFLIMLLIIFVCLELFFIHKK